MTDQPLTNAFPDKEPRPDDGRVADVLGESWVAWCELQDFIRGQAPSATIEWKHYGRKLGWQLKVASGKRSILYLIPHAGSFLAALALRPAAIEAAGTAPCGP